MSEFTVDVVRVTIEPHPNADALEIARVGGYLSLVRKGDYQTGDLAAYIPSDALLPDWLLKSLGMWDDMNGKGMLSGAGGRRVRPKRLRGIFSEGILLKPRAQLFDQPIGGETVNYAQFSTDVPNTIVQAIEGQNVAQGLGIKKYEVAVPAHLAGNAAGGDLDATFSYDFDNIKKNPTMFDGIEVVITEKLHGTHLQVGLIPERIWAGKSWAEKCPSFDLGEQGIWKGTVTSKGLGGKGIMLDPNDSGNLYVQTVLDGKIWDVIASQTKSAPFVTGEQQPVFLFGEIYGGKDPVQTGFSYGSNKPTFRAFDLAIGTRNKHIFAAHDDFIGFCGIYDIPVVPVLWRGTFDQGVMLRLTDGDTTLDDAHMREGVVVKAAFEGRDKLGRRLIAKSISEAYLLRKGKVSEFT